MGSCREKSLYRERSQNSNIIIHTFFYHKSTMFKIEQVSDIRKCMRMINLCANLFSCSWLNAKTGKVKVQTIFIKEGREFDCGIVGTEIHIVLHCTANHGVSSCDAVLVFIIRGCLTGHHSLGCRWRNQCGWVLIIIALKEVSNHAGLIVDIFNRLEGDHRNLLAVNLNLALVIFLRLLGTNWSLGSWITWFSFRKGNKLTIN